MLHTIRQVVTMTRSGGDPAGLNAHFWHQTVQGSDVEQYISQGAGVDLSKVFDQYLRDVRVPVLEYRAGRDSVSYRWTEVVPGFDMPVKVTVGARRSCCIPPSSGRRSPRPARRGRSRWTGTST